MTKVKKYLKPTLFVLGGILIYLFALSLLHYAGTLTLKTIGSINFAVAALVSLLAGLRRGKKTSKKGYLEGLKLGGIIVLILFIMNLILYRSFSLYAFLYYFLILVSTTIGSMIGINLKR